MNIQLLVLQQHATTAIPVQTQFAMREAVCITLELMNIEYKLSLSLHIHNALHMQLVCFVLDLLSCIMEY